MVLSLVVIAAMFALASATTVVFGRIRPAAAWLMVPYLAWIVFAGVLTYRIHVLNPRCPKPCAIRRQHPDCALT